MNPDKIKFLMIGELLELRIETTWFQKNYIWEPHLFALTNIGLIKFQQNDITGQPKFMSLQSMNVELLPCDSQNPTEMIFRVCYKTFPSKSETYTFLSSDKQEQIVDWINCIKGAITKFNPQLFKSRSEVRIGIGVDTLSNYNSSLVSQR